MQFLQQNNLSTFLWLCVFNYVTLHGLDESLNNFASHVAHQIHLLQLRGKHENKILKLTKTKVSFIWSHHTKRLWAVEWIRGGNGRERNQDNSKSEHLDSSTETIDLAQ